MLLVGYGEESLESTEHPIAPPILGQLDRGALKISGVALQLLLELLEESEGIGSSTGEAGEQLAAVQRTHFLRVRLHHRLTHGDLAVTAQRNLPIPAHAQYRGRANALAIGFHRFKLMPLLC